MDWELSQWTKFAIYHQRSHGFSGRIKRLFQVTKLRTRGFMAIAGSASCSFLFETAV